MKIGTPGVLWLALALAPLGGAEKFVPAVALFPAGDVRILGGPFKHAEIMNRAWLKFRVDRLTTAQLQNALRIEHGGINEALANLYSLTRDPDHLRLAEAFNHQLLFEPLSRGLDPLGPPTNDPQVPGGLLHGNTQMPKALGAAREFEVTGNATYRTVAENFWRFVTQHRTFIFGGNTDTERFFARGTESRHLSPVTGEGCNTYNMLKLTCRLFTWGPEAAQMDFFERALFNHILATQHPDTGGIIYFIATSTACRD